MSDNRQFVEECRADLRSGDRKRIESVFFVYGPRIGRGAYKEIDEAASLIPDIRELLKDRRFCCLTPTACFGRRFGEVRWWAASTLAHLLDLLGTPEPIIVRDIIRPVSYEPLQAYRKQTGTYPKGSTYEQFEYLRDIGYLPMIPAINLGSQPMLGELYSTGWIDYFKGNGGGDVS